MRYLSPLRYPGGKGRMAPYIARLLASQDPRPRAYAEPFAGGAGAALRLLVDEEVSTIYINDLSPGIAAFWRCVFEHTDALTARIMEAPVDVDAWHTARAIYEQPQGHSDLALGFATFFLNRCNRSGILGARPIGGLDQTGRWKIDARFNRDNLADRVRLLGGYRGRVHVSQLDARDFLRTLEAQGTDVLVYVDPPYLVQGEDLYLDSLRPEDHAELAGLLRASGLPWFLTYDVHEQITTGLYGGLRTAEFDIAHTAQKQHIGAEYAVFSDALTVPGIDLMRSGASRWIGSSAPA
jgi:DNA adenine methylase